MASVLDIPTYEPDLFSDQGILEPNGHYAAMRALGPVVHLPGIDCHAVTRFEECRTVLRDSARYISGRGVALNAPMNATPTSVIAADGERHSFMREIEGEPLSPKAVLALRARISTAAENLIDDLLAKDTDRHDAVSDIAAYLPLTVVMELGGLPPQGRAQMLRWAAAAFDALGPLNARSQTSLPIVQGLIAFVRNEVDRNSVTPGSWSARAFALADAGKIPPEMVGNILSDFIVPSLDTTIAGTSNLLMLLGQNPAEWEKLKADRGKIPNAINESLRLGSPIRCFSRVATENSELGGVHLPAGSRVAVFFASANRDETIFPDPDRFDIGRRNASDQLAFGIGAHQCVGASLARLEITAILNALLDRVDRIEVGEPTYAINNLLRTLQSLPIRLHARTR